MNANLLDLEEFLPYRLSVLSNTISGTLAEAYSSQHGLTIPEWRVLAILGRFPGSSAGEVAERGAMDKVAVSRAVSRLLKAGRIRRRFADADRRRSILDLSDAGWNIYGQVIPVLLAYEADLLEGLSASERRQLDKLLKRLSERAGSVRPAVGAQVRSRSVPHRARR
jgi:DNA-binding MarR family transcriptional regulator